MTVFVVTTYTEGGGHSAPEAAFEAYGAALGYIREQEATWLQRQRRFPELANFSDEQLLQKYGPEYEITSLEVDP